MEGEGTSVFLSSVLAVSSQVEAARKLCLNTEIFIPTVTFL